MAPFRRHNPAGSSASLFGSYPMRMMASLATSLLVIGLCFHLPLDVPPDRIGWQIAPHIQQPMLELIDIKPKPANEGAGMPVTNFGANEKEIEVAEDEAVEEEEIESEPEALPTPTALPPIEKLKVRPALDFADQMPDIAGGMGAYYIHIDYPEEAIDKGIQGRLVLAFVVEPNGAPSEIEVLRSLHPLCDSSAVNALRKTRFIPGRQNGQIVRVRMRLPVRFRLVDPESTDSTTATQS